MAWTKVGDVEGRVPTGSAPVAFNLPAGTTTDDIVIVAIACDANLSATGGITTSGYTTISRPSVDNPGYQVAYKVMGGSPDTTVTVDDEASVGRDEVVMIQVWRGVDTGTPIDATATLANGNSGDPDCASITTVTNGALVIAIGLVDDDDAAGTITAPSGYTNLSDHDVGAGDGTTGATVMMSSKEVATAGAEDPGAYVVTGGDDFWRAVTIALRPAGGAASEVELMAGRQCIVVG